MRFTDISGPAISQEFGVLRAYCSQFIEESAGLPLIKYLPISYNNIQKVKVRQKNHKSILGETMDRAFSDRAFNLSGRAVFTYSNTLKEFDYSLEPFYVLPVNGYKFLYSTEIKDSSTEHKDLIEGLINEFGNSSLALTTAEELIKFTYSDSNLKEGIESGSEIIFYNIPNYYAVRSTYTNYNNIVG